MQYQNMTDAELVRWTENNFWQNAPDGVTALALELAGRLEAAKDEVERLGAEVRAWELGEDAVYR